MLSAKFDELPEASPAVDLTLTVIAERLGCEPDAEAICVAIEKLKRRAADRRR